MSDPFLDNIFKNSEKAKFMDRLGELLKEYDKVALTLGTTPAEDGKFCTLTLTLGCDTCMEAIALFEYGKHDVIENW